MQGLSPATTFGFGLSGGAIDTKQGKGTVRKVPDCCVGAQGGNWADHGWGLRVGGWGLDLERNPGLQTGVGGGRAKNREEERC